MGGRTVDFQLRDSHAGRSPTTSPKKTLRGQHGFHERDQAPVAASAGPACSIPTEMVRAHSCPPPTGPESFPQSCTYAANTWEVSMWKGYILSAISCFFGASDPPLLQSQGNILSLSVGGSLSAQGLLTVC